jgi:excisionase family DNA binding protein
MHSLTKEGEMESLLSVKETAGLLGITESTLATWRCLKRYNLPWIKVGRLCKYRREDIEKFISDRTHS